MSWNPEDETRRMVVSACLAGAACRYDGASQPFEPARELVRRGLALPVCPEQLGGLCTPRTPCEIVRGGDGAERVMDADGADRTGAFERGAREALELARLFGAEAALLKANSPSCGCGMVYDGSFSGARKPGNGLFARLLLAEGVDVFTEADAHGGGEGRRGNGPVDACGTRDAKAQATGHAVGDGAAGASGPARPAACGDEAAAHAPATSRPDAKAANLRASHGPGTDGGEQGGPA